MPSTLRYIRYPKSTVDKITRVFPKTLPNIKVPVGEKRSKMGVTHHEIKSSEGRLLMVGKYVTQLFREERIEVLDSVSYAVRPYAERLVQLAIEYGDCHKPTMEVCNYYLHEKDLIHKLFKVFVPRYRDCPTAFTSVHQLPDFYGPDEFNAIRYFQHYPVILEMKGNPYPPVVPKPETHGGSILNVLLNSARKQYALEKKTKSRQSEASSSSAAAPDDVKNV